MNELLFPCNPTVGQIFQRWTWNGTQWVTIGRGSGFAPLDSPDFTGMPTGPTPEPGSNDAKLATTSFVMQAVAAMTAGVASFNTRTGHVTLTTVDIVNAGGAPILSPHFLGQPEADTAPPGTATRVLATTEFVQQLVSDRLIVDSFNGRVGDVTLRWDDVMDVGGAPLRDPFFLGIPRAVTPPATDNSTRLATTAYVTDAITVSRAASVTSFNQRHGDVVFRPSDLSAVGGAFLASPHFTGLPTAPTAPPQTNSDQLATTRYVDAAIASNPGPPGPPGPRGPEGPAGPNGRGLEVVGTVPTVGDLPMTGNQVGDVWTVGPNDEGFWWDGAKWVSMGEIQGAQGIQGLTGPQGVPGGNAKVQTTAPTAPVLGELWKVPTGGTQIWQGTEWAPMPGTNYVGPLATDYTSVPTDDIVEFNIAISRMYILPLISSVPIGKTILVRFRIPAGITLTINSQGGDTIQALSSTGINPIVTNYGAVPGGLPLLGGAFGTWGEVTAINRGTSWQLTNRGIPIDTPWWKTPGLVPGPLNTTPANAALQADMTWKVPGRTVVDVYSTSYSVVQTDEIVRVNSASSQSTITLPEAYSTDIGTRITILAISVGTNGLIVNATPPNSIYANGINQGLSISSPIGSDVLAWEFINIGFSWCLYGVL